MPTPPVKELSEEPRADAVEDARTKRILRRAVDSVVKTCLDRAAVVRPLVDRFLETGAAFRAADDADLLAAGAEYDRAKRNLISKYRREFGDANLAHLIVDDLAEIDGGRRR